MLGVRLPSDLEERLTNLAELTGRTKSYYVKKALSSWLDEHEDTLIALARLEKKGKRIPLKQLEKELGLDR
ncbi:MAG TPA: ribbon-helix-helix domain-containing protein [bacterium]|nr:ribbon-helix-helix domain-containing protein [bacterium]